MGRDAWEYKVVVGRAETRGSEKRDTKLASCSLDGMFDLKESSACVVGCKDRIGMYFGKHRKDKMQGVQHQQGSVGNVNRRPSWHTVCCTSPHTK